jgi:hypothetical protein
MKRLSIALLVILLICSLLAGCGTKEKIEQKVGEKLVEEAVEKALGDENTEIDLDGDKITVKDKEGETLSLGSAEWPPDIDYIPEFKQGQIISAAHDSDGNVMIMLEEVERKSFEDYLENIKKLFPEEPYEMQADEYLLFEGKNAKGEKISLQYFLNDNSLTIVGRG